MKSILKYCGIHLIAFFCISLSFCSAKTYYIDQTNGKDSNNGISESTPWKTIAKVNSSQFQPGDFIKFKCGEVWRERLNIPSSGDRSSAITFTSYGTGNKPEIKGSEAISSWIQDGTIWDATVATEPKVVWFNGLAGIKVASRDACTSLNKWFWEKNKLSIYAINYPTGIEAASRTNALHSSEKKYIFISNIHFVNGGNGTAGGTVVISTGASDWTIDSCDFAQAHTCHIGIWDTASGNIIISNSTFSHSGLGHFIGAGNAIDVTTTTNPLVIVEKCTFTHVGDWAGSGYHDHGIYFKGGRLIWRYNYQYDGGTETGASVKISNNAQDGCEIYYNVISSGGGIQSWGVLSEAGSGHKVYNNVFYGVGTGVWQSGSNGPTVKGGSGITIKNNIFHTTPYCFIKGTATTNLVSDYNVFYNGPASPFAWGKTPYSLADWKINTNQDSHSISIDPKFIRAAENNFHLQPSSSCINAGIGVGLTHDFDMNPVPQGGSVDMGAFQYKNIISPPQNLQVTD
jgi:hypothetical protein